MSRGSWPCDGSFRVGLGVPRLHLGVPVVLAGRGAWRAGPAGAGSGRAAGGARHEERESSTAAKIPRGTGQRIALPLVQAARRPRLTELACSEGRLMMSWRTRVAFLARHLRDSNTPLQWRQTRIGGRAEGSRASGHGGWSRSDPAARTPTEALTTGQRHGRERSLGRRPRSCSRSSIRRVSAQPAFAARSGRSPPHDVEHLRRLGRQHHAGATR